MLLMKRSSKLLFRRCPIIVALLLHILSSSSAIDLSFNKAFGGKIKDSHLDVSTTELALENAKKLVDEMNDAATGTVTRYQPGREKEPVTCDDIMAKALVVAKEEKVAVMEERNSIVKAAGLLSNRVDELGEQLQAARDEIQQLKKRMEEERAVFEEKIDATAQDSAKQIQVIMQQTAEYQSNAKKTIQKMKESVEVARREAYNAIEAEVEKSKIKRDNLKNQTHSVITMIEVQCNEKLSLKDADVALELEKAKTEIQRVKSEAEEEIAFVKTNASDEITAILSHTESEKLQIIESTRAELEKMSEERYKEKKLMEEDIAQIKKDAAEDIKRNEALANERIKKERHESEMAVAAAEAKVSIEKERNLKANKAFRKATGESTAKIAELNDRIERLQRDKSGLQNEVVFWKQTHEAQGYCNITLIRDDSKRLTLHVMQNIHEYMSSSKIALMNSFNTLMAMSIRMSHETMDFIEDQVAPTLKSDMIQVTNRVKSLYEEYLAIIVRQTKTSFQNVFVFMRKEIFPTLESLGSKAHHGLVSLYDDYVSSFVNKKLVPLFNQHILPVYNQHIFPVYKKIFSPIIKGIKKETAVFIGKSHELLLRIQFKAVSLAKKQCSSLVKLIEKNNIDRMLPSWLLLQLERFAKDGNLALDVLWKGCLLLLVIICRLRRRKIIYTLFSVIWFLCPIRFILRRDKPDDSRKKRNTDTQKKSNAINGLKNKTKKNDMTEID